MVDPLAFAELLRVGILEIQRQESREKKKFLKDIHQELARSIDRNTTTVEHYLKGYVPTTKAALEQLAKEIFLRGVLNQKWLEDFLEKGGHPNPSVIIDDLLLPTPQQVDNLDAYLYKRVKLHTHQQVLPQGRCISTTHVQIKVISDSTLDSLRHRFVTDNTLATEPMKLQFTSGEHSGGGLIRHRVLKSTPDILVWMIDFTPPLKPNQTASYTYVQARDNWHPWTYEDCESLNNAGVSLGALVRARWTVLVPVDDFNFTVELPPNYPISLPASGGFGVYLGLAEELKEKTRLIAEKSFSAAYDQTNKQWVLSLHVKNARSGLQYEIQWIPPLQEQITEYLGTR
jgi:hypothetical protein